MHFIFHYHQVQNFSIINYFRFANDMNNTTIINTFNIDNSNIANINSQHRQLMTTITYEILNFEPMIKKPIVTNYTFFPAVTFININSFTYINSIVIQYLKNSFI